MLGTACPITQHHTPEGCSVQRHWNENLKFHKYRKTESDYRFGFGLRRTNFTLIRMSKHCFVVMVTLIYKVCFYATYLYNRTIQSCHNGIWLSDIIFFFFLFSLFYFVHDLTLSEALCFRAALPLLQTRNTPNVVDPLDGAIHRQWGESQKKEDCISDTFINLQYNKLYLA